MTINIVHSALMELDPSLESSLEEAFSPNHLVESKEFSHIAQFMSSIKQQYLVRSSSSGGAQQQERLHLQHSMRFSSKLWQRLEAHNILSVEVLSKCTDDQVDRMRTLVEDMLCVWNICMARLERAHEEMPDALQVLCTLLPLHSTLRLHSRPSSLHSLTHMLHACYSAPAHQRPPANNPQNNSLHRALHLIQHTLHHQECPHLHTSNPENPKKRRRLASPCHGSLPSCSLMLHQQPFTSALLHLLRCFLIVFGRSAVAHQLMDSSSLWMPFVHHVLQSRAALLQHDPNCPLLSSCFYFLNELFHENAEACRWFMDRYSSLIESVFIPLCLQNQAQTPSTRKILATLSPYCSFNLCLIAPPTEPSPIWILTLSIVTNMLTHGLCNLLPQIDSTLLCWEVFQLLMKLVHLLSVYPTERICSSPLSYVPSLLRLFLQSTHISSASSNTFKDKITRTILDTIPLFVRILHSEYTAKSVNYQYSLNTSIFPLAPSTTHFSADIIATLSCIVEENESAREKLLLPSNSDHDTQRAQRREFLHSPQSEAHSSEAIMQFLLSCVTTKDIDMEPTKMAAVTLIKHLSRSNFSVRKVLIDSVDGASSSRTRTLYEALAELLLSLGSRKSVDEGIVQSPLKVKLVSEVIASLSNLAMDFIVVKDFLSGSGNSRQEGFQDASHANTRASTSLPPSESFASPDSKFSSPFLQVLDQLSRFGASETLRRNSVWALKNIAFCASINVRESLLHNVTLPHIIEMMHSPYDSVTLEAVCFLRNIFSEDQYFVHRLLSTESTFSSQLTKEIYQYYHKWEGNTTEERDRSGSDSEKPTTSADTELLIQLNYLLSNLLAGQTQREKRKILPREILQKIVTLCKHSNQHIVKSALWVLLNYCWKSSQNARQDEESSLSEEEGGDPESLLQIEGFMSVLERLCNLPVRLEEGTSEGSTRTESPTHAFRTPHQSRFITDGESDSSQVFIFIRNVARQLKQIISEACG